MPVIGATALTLADWAKRVDDNYKIATIIELLSQTNEILDDMLFVQGNLPTGHRTTVRTGLPAATWRLLNYGVPNGKSTTAQITDSCGNLETYSVVDKDIADLNGNTPEFRFSEVKAFLEGMNQQVSSTVFYGNTAVNPERFMGLTPRYNTLDPAKAQTANNVIDMLGTGGTNTSIWIITWGSETMHGIFPKGKMSGLQHRDMGEWPVQDVNGNTYQAYRDHFKWECGLTVRDWRFAVRLANIDVTTLSGGTPPDLLRALIRGLYKLPVASGTAQAVQKSDAPSISSSMGKTAIYCNRSIRTWLDIQAVDKKNVLLSIDEYDGKVCTMFRGVPIKTCDALLNNEARVVV